MARKTKEEKRIEAKVSGLLRTWDYPNRREKAIAELEGLGDVGVQLVIEQVLATRNSYRQLWLPLFIDLLLKFLIVATIFEIIHLVFQWSWESLRAGMFGGLSVTFASAIWWFKTRDSSVHALALLNDPRAIGPLALALTADSTEVRRSARGALANLLPRLTPELAGKMTLEQQECLLRTLDRADSEVAGPVLKVIPLLSASAALPHLQALASRKTGGAAQEDVLILEAWRILPEVAERTAQERAGDRLLRPAEPNFAEGLLRPAAVAASDESLLLRPNTAGPAA